TSAVASSYAESASAAECQSEGASAWVVASSARLTAAAERSSSATGRVHGPTHHTLYISSPPGAGATLSSHSCHAVSYAVRPELAVLAPEVCPASITRTRCVGSADPRRGSASASEARATVATCSQRLSELRTGRSLGRGSACSATNFHTTVRGTRRLRWRRVWR